MPVVECHGVAKSFYHYEHRTVTLREWFIRTLSRRDLHVRSPVFTLSEFNLEVPRGGSIALIGPNGSGKSTALRLVAGVYAPNDGSIVTRGRIAPVLELGAGFHPELTGEENVAFYGAVLGLTRAELRRRYDDIVSFSEIGTFIDLPVKRYSSGMRARLAFSVAMAVAPDILLLDEVLAVGDERFREKCLERLKGFHDDGGTLLLASHSLGLVRALCSEALWLDRGVTRLFGPVDAVADAYLDNGGVQSAGGR